MTSMDSHDLTAGPDPVHPRMSGQSRAENHSHSHTTVAERAARTRHSRAEEARTEPPLAADLGTPAQELGELLDDLDLYPEEILSEVATRAGFGAKFDDVAGLSNA